jgi:hypothetical protein
LEVTRLAREHKSATLRVQETLQFIEKSLKAIFPIICQFDGNFFFDADIDNDDNSSSPMSSISE